MWLTVTIVVSARIYSPSLDNAYCGDILIFLSVSNFYNQFRLPRVMIFNWRKRPFYLQLLLLLCGDVHLNPGLEVFLCGFCSEPVSEQDKAMCCDGCGKWIHVSCDQYFIWRMNMTI